jgi:hypothetical protein
MSLVGTILNIKVFSQTITTANTPVQLTPPSGYSSNAYNHITLINTSEYSIYVGDKNNQLIEIAANGGTYSIDIHYPNIINISSIYIVSSNSGASLIVTYA